MEKQYDYKHEANRYIITARDVDPRNTGLSYMLCLP